MRRVADLANPRVVVGVDGVDGLAGPREPGAMTTSVSALVPIVPSGLVVDISLRLASTEVIVRVGA